MKLKFSDFFFPIAFVILLWLIHILQFAFHLHWISFGVYPLKLKGLVGIISMPLVHGSFVHLMSNTFPLLTLLVLLKYFYRTEFWGILLFIWISTGLWLWIFGRSSWHIGASGVVFGLFGYILFSGIFSRKKELIAISLLVWFLYAGSLWYIFPGKEQISWEGHLLGFLSGMILSVYHYFLTKRKKIGSEYDFSSEYLYVNNSMNKEIFYIFKQK